MNVIIRTLPNKKVMILDNDTQVREIVEPNQVTRIINQMILNEMNQEKGNDKI